MDGWLEEQNYDHHEELDHALWNMAEKGIGESEYPMAAEPASPATEQGVVMC